MQPPDDQPWELRFHKGMLHLAAPATFNPERELKLDGWRWVQSFGRWSSSAAGHAAFRDSIPGQSQRFADRVATSIKQGAVPASLMRRRLGSHPRRNGLARALREY